MMLLIGPETSMVKRKYPFSGTEFLSTAAMKFTSAANESPQTAKKSATAKQTSAYILKVDIIDNHQFLSFDFRWDIRFFITFF